MIGNKNSLEYNPLFILEDDLCHCHVMIMWTILKVCLLPLFSFKILNIMFVSNKKISQKEENKKKLIFFINN